MSGLNTLFPTDTEDLGALHDRLTAKATEEGLIDVAYRSLDSPIGRLLLASTERGLVTIGLAGQDEDDLLQGLADRISPRVLRAPGRLDQVAKQLEEYFAGRRSRFEVALDHQLSHGFRRRVLEHLVDVNYGATVSYHDLAVLAGNANASRAVGSACATNPIPIIVPCHRVLRSGGGLGGYAGGLTVKRWLLDLEAGGRPQQPVLV